MGCRVCGTPCDRAYCGAACSQKGYRRRRAGLPEDWRAEGAQRGRVPLGEETARESENSRLSDWFVTFRAEVERCHREVKLLRVENGLLRRAVERLRGLES